MSQSGRAHLGEGVRRLREQRGWTLRAFAERVGFSPSFLSQVETGQSSPSIGSMERIAAALGVTLGEFFRVQESAEASAPRRIVRRGARATISAEWSRAELERLSDGGSLDALLVTLEPEGASASAKHPAPEAPVDEFALVLEGPVALDLGGGAELLEAGDAVNLRAGTPRRWYNPGPQTVRVLLVSARPRA